MSEETTPVQPYDNWNFPTLFIVLGNILVMVFLIWAFLDTRKKLEEARFNFAVYWKNTDSIAVKPGPSWFLVDCSTDSIKSLKRINDAEKSQLLNLAEGQSKACGSFVRAIDLLVFKSNCETQGHYYLALMIAAICGAIGVQLRSINNFIGVACFGRRLEPKVWWPWYILRPLIGALIGAILYTLIDGNLYSMPDNASYSNMAVIALAVVAGFGSEDFLDLLRKLSKRFFGTSNPKKPDATT